MSQESKVTFACLTLSAFLLYLKSALNHRFRNTWIWSLVWRAVNITCGFLWSALEY